MIHGHRLEDRARLRVRIVIVQLVPFFSFGLNQWLQYRGIGRWTDYIDREKTYRVLSLAAKSLLAWQIYFPSLDS